MRVLSLFIIVLGRWGVVLGSLIGNGTQFPRAFSIRVLRMSFLCSIRRVESKNAQRECLELN